MFNQPKNRVNPEDLATKAVIIERLRKIFPDERTEHLRTKVCPELKFIAKTPVLNSDEAKTINKTAALIESIVNTLKK